MWTLLLLAVTLSLPEQNDHYTQEIKYQQMFDLQLDELPWNLEDKKLRKDVAKERDCILDFIQYKTETCAGPVQKVEEDLQSIADKKAARIRDIKKY